jgi:hypothetical protein
MRIPNVFDRRWRQRPRSQRTDTRSQAAESLQPALPDLQRQVLAFIIGRQQRGATDEEIYIGLLMKPATVRAGRAELRDDGLVVDSKKRRRTASGHTATVWITASISREIIPAGPFPAAKRAANLDLAQLYPCADFRGAETRGRQRRR